MTADDLTELQRTVNAGKVPPIEQCAALIGEIWRLKTKLASKGIEVDYWRGGSDELNSKLRAMNDANERLRQEIEQLRTVHGLASCQLENRWSNCAVRLKKREHKQR
ncbi:MAG: hypothetical protein ACREQN_16205 [Candidatus Binataceae bacterium]